MSHKVDISKYREVERSGKIGSYANSTKYLKEINYLSKVLEIPFHRIGILEDTADGDNWIMIGGHWRGNLDDWFYECLNTNAPKSVFFMESEA